MKRDLDENEVTLKIQEIIRQAVENVELPHFVKVIEVNNRPCLNITLNNPELGISITTYDFTALIERKYHFVTQQFAKIEIPQDVEIKPVIEAFTYRFCQSLLSIFTRQQSLLFGNIDRLVDESQLAATRATASELVHPNSKRNFDNLLNQIRKETIEQAISLEEPREDLLLISYFYNLIHPICVKVRKLHRQNKKSFKNRKRNFEILEKIYADYFFPKDLMERLEVDKKGDYSSDIAVEFAARLCGQSPNEKQKSALYTYRENSLKWVEENGKDALATRLDSYALLTYETLELNYKFAQITQIPIRSRSLFEDVILTYIKYPNRENPILADVIQQFDNLPNIK